MKKLIPLFIAGILLTSCGSTSSSSENAPSSENSSSVVYEDVKVKDIVFPASSKLTIDKWSDTKYDLIYDDAITVYVSIHDISHLDSAVKDRLRFNEDDVKRTFASLDLLDTDENAYTTVDLKTDYSNTGFYIYTLSRDDTTAYYATQVINDNYYTIIVSTGKIYNSFEKHPDNKISDYYDDFCDIVNSVKPV